MNVAMQLTQTATSVAQQDAFPLQSADRRDDLYAAWKSIFEHARASESVQRDSHDRESVTNKRQTNGLADNDAPRGFHTSAQAQIANPDEPKSIASAFARVSASPDPDGALITRNPPPYDWRTSLDIRSTNAPSTSLGPVTGPLSSMLEPCSVANTSEELPKNQFASQTENPVQQSIPAESVSVFVDGEKVAVVLRDSAISNEAALQSAFETARELTGQRATLQRLTVNGRTLYQQQDSPAHALPALEFLC